MAAKEKIKEVVQGQGDERPVCRDEHEEEKREIKDDVGSAEAKADMPGSEPATSDQEERHSVDPTGGSSDQGDEEHSGTPMPAGPARVQEQDVEMGDEDDSQPAEVADEGESNTRPRGQTVNEFVKNVQVNIGNGSAKPEQSDPTSPLSEFSPEFEPLPGELAGMVGKLLNSHILIVRSCDIDVADSYAFLLACAPEFELGFSRRGLDLDPETGCDVRHSGRLLDWFQSGRGVRKSVVLVSAFSDSGSNSVEWIRSIAAGRQRTLSDLKYKLVAARTYWIVATDLELEADHVHSLSDRYCEIDFLSPRLRSRYPDTWEVLLDDVERQREQGRWPKAESFFYEACNNLLRQDEFHRHVEERRSTPAEELAGSRREKLGLEKLLDPTRRLEAVVHFVATFFPKLEAMDFDCLVLELIGDESESDRVEATSGMAWREPGKSLVDVWKEQRSQIMSRCGVVVLPPRKSSRRGAATGRGAPAVDYRDSEMRLELQRFYWSEGHSVFLEFLNRLDIRLLFHSSSELRRCLAQIVAETADAYPEHFGSAWIRRLHDSLSSEAVEGGPGRSLIRALEALTRALLSRPQARRIVGRFFAEIRTKRPGLHLSLTRSLRFVDHFDPTIGWRMFLESGGSIPYVPGLMPWIEHVRTTSTPGQVIAAFRDTLLYLEESRTDELSRVTVWHLGGPQDFLKRNLVMIQLWLGWRLCVSIGHGKEGGDETPRFGKILGAQRVRHLLQTILDPSKEPSTTHWLRIVLDPEFDVFITEFVTGVALRELRDFLRDYPSFGGLSDDAEAAVLQVIRTRVSMEIRGTWIRDTLWYWILGAKNRRLIGTEQARILASSLTSAWLGAWEPNDEHFSFLILQSVITAQVWWLVDGIEPDPLLDPETARKVAREIPGVLRSSLTSAGAQETDRLQVVRRHWLFMATALRKVQYALRRRLRNASAEDKRLVETALAETLERRASIKRLERACRDEVRRVARRMAHVR